MGELNLYVSETGTSVNRSVTVIFSRHPEVLGAKRRASKDDGPNASADILRGPLRDPIALARWVPFAAASG